MKKLPPDIRKLFREQGAKGGKIGGWRALETMTPRAAKAKKNESNRVR